MAKTPGSTPTQIDRVTNQQGTPGGWWPSDTPGPRTPLPTAPVSARPADATLELMVTVRLLRDELRRGTLQPGPPARMALRNTLTELINQPTLGSTRAAALRVALVEQLSAQEQLLLGQRRAALERSVQNLLARARLATPGDGPLDLNRIKYQFMLPDGMNVLRALAQQPSLNPYFTPGANATLLTELLELLRIASP